jgi:hypothetical protein
VSARVFWPSAEAAQTDYELLRSCMLVGPRWAPHADPRAQALAAACQFLLDAAGALAAPVPQLTGDGH